MYYERGVKIRITQCQCFQKFNATYIRYIHDPNNSKIIAKERPLANLNRKYVAGVIENK